LNFSRVGLNGFQNGRVFNGRNEKAAKAVEQVAAIRG